jgi:hypothetical protein
VPAKLPSSFDTRASAETLDLVGMHTAQQAGRQNKAAQGLQLANLRQQAFEPDTAGIGGKAGKSGPLAAIGEQRASAETETLRPRRKPPPQGG